MASPLNFSTGVSLALHAMAILSLTEEKRLSTGHIAEELDASSAHMSKVLQRLSRTGLVESVPGPSGGFRLAKDESAITLADVYEAIEGPLNNVACIFHSPVCDSESCLFGDVLQDINLQLRDWLNRTTLSDLAGNRLKCGV